MNRSRLKRFGPLLVLAAAGIIVAIMMLTRSQPQQAEPERGTLVETRTFTPSQRTIIVPAAGSVRPAVQTTVLADVSGRVVAVHPDLVPGGRVDSGEVLIQIDREDFELRVRQQRAALAQARADYELELGRRKVAEREWELFADELAPEQRDAALALREPQLQSARARVESAEAALAEAELALQRTSVEAPYDAVVLSEEVDRGQFVSPQTAIATLIGTERLWVEASVQADRLPFIDIGPQDGSVAQVRYDAGEFTVTRQGRVTRLLSQLAESARLARVLIDIPQPWDAASESGIDLPLLLNAWVDVTIEGNLELSGIELPRQYLRGENEVWVYDEGELDVRPVTVAWETSDRAFVTAGLDADDRVVVSSIAAPAEGMALRLPDAGGDRDDKSRMAGRESGAPGG